MIASPCKNCPKENLPKTVCAKDCELLEAVQNFQKAAEESGVASRQDYIEDIGYSTSLSEKNVLVESSCIEYF